MERDFNIVLIEDNPIEVMILKKTFFNINANCAFTEFADGEEAMTYLENLKKKDAGSMPDMIITDLYLPKMNGLDFLTVLKKDEVLRTIPVVMFSNSNSESDIKQAYKLNVNSYIIKPLNLGVYKETIRSFWNFWTHAASLPHPYTGLNNVTI